LAEWIVLSVTTSSLRLYSGACGMPMSLSAQRSQISRNVPTVWQAIAGAVERLFDQTVHRDARRET